MPIESTYVPGSGGKTGEFQHTFSFGASDRGGYKWAVNNAQELQSTPYHATFLGGLKNLVTGDLDFAREVELLKQSQAFNAQEAAKSREWQEAMSNTSHQREAADLIASGFNPALTLGSGGANAYSAATASSGSPGHQASGRGIPAIMQLIMGLLSLGVNNARKVDALGQTLDMADKKLNAQLISNDARLNALQAHYDSQADYFSKRIKLGEARNSLAISDSYEKMKMDRSKFNANYARGFRV